MRGLLAACALALALPALVAAASNPVVDAAKRTAEAKSSTFQSTVTTAVGSRKITMRGSGAVSGSNARISMRSLGLRIDAILVRERGRYVMYLRSPLLQSQLPPGKRWLRLDLSKQAANLGIDLSSLLGAYQTLAPLERGLVSTKRLGREVVAGRATTRYHAVIDVHRAAGAIPAYAQQVAALERATGIRLGKLAYDVWIAGDGRIYRLRFGMPTRTAGLRARVVQTITYLSFDKPVTIAAPPRSQVATF